LIQFNSFEEILALLGGLGVTLIAYKLFRMTLITSGLMGLLSAVFVAYITLFEFVLENNVITYRNRFRETSFPISHVRSVGMSTFWAGLPGHTFMFVMRRPPAPTDGYFMRTGLISWPSAGRWVEAVNTAIKNNASER
jgi:hypothetical protein